MIYLEKFDKDYVRIIIKQTDKLIQQQCRPSQSSERRLLKKRRYRGNRLSANL